MNVNAMFVLYCNVLWYLYDVTQPPDVSA